MNYLAYILLIPVLDAGIVVRPAVGGRLRILALQLGHGRPCLRLGQSTGPCDAGARRIPR